MIIRMRSACTSIGSSTNTAQLGMNKQRRKLTSAPRSGNSNNYRSPQWKQQPCSKRSNHWIKLFAVPYCYLSTNATTAVAAFSTSSSSNTLAENMRTAFEQSATDGIISLSRDIICQETSSSSSSPAANIFIEAAIDASSGSKGNTGSIINGLIAGCDKNDNPIMAADLFETLLSDYGDVVEPDLVTYACAYSACLRPRANQEEEETDQQQKLNEVAELALEQARKTAKKRGGNARRKALVKSRRRGKPIPAQDISDTLSSKYDGLRVLFENEHVIGLYKPSGMVCRHTHKTTAGKRNDVSLEDALTSTSGNIALSSVNPQGRGMVHRIDRGTSGCIVMAKDDETHLRLVSEFFQRGVKKSYLALVPGGAAIPEMTNNGNSIDLVVDGYPARSRYEVVEVHGNGVAMTLRVHTETGRKHQVRVHCAEGLGRPIFLDNLYGGGGEAASLEEDHDNAVIRSMASSIKPGHKLFLHAESISIPRFGVEFEAPVPAWWNDAIDSFDSA